jgi:alpha-tubulin suppressor-like RCC1 family protein
MKLKILCIKTKEVVMFFLIFTVLFGCKNQYLVAEESIIKFTGNVNHQKIAGGISGAVVVKDDGTVWGISQIDYSDTSSEDYKGDVLKKIEGLENIVSVEGDGFYLALDDGGNVWQFRDSGNSIFTDIEKVEGVGNIISIYVQECTGIGIKEDGTVWRWGTKKLPFFIGDCQEEEMMPEPLQIEGLENIVSIRSGVNYGFYKAVDYRGNLYIIYGDSDLTIGDMEFEHVSEVNGVDNVKHIINYGVILNDGIHHFLELNYELLEKNADDTEIGVYYLSELAIIADEVGNIVEASTKVGNIVAVAGAYITNILLNDTGDVWALKYWRDHGHGEGEALMSFRGTLFETDQEIVISSDNIEGDAIDGTEIAISKKIMSNVEQISMGVHRIYAIKNDGTVWYMGQSFDPVTEEDKNNIDYILPDRVRDREDFKAEDEIIIKNQNKPKQLKYE